MANNKTGFNYYSVDTDRYQDIKIKRLKKDFGCAGIAVYDYILCEIYRVRGCFIEWDESTAFDVAEYFGLKESLVNEIVNYCGVVGLFDKGLLTSGSALTSLAIQNRYIDWCKKAKRVSYEIPKNIKLTEESEIIQEESFKPPEECAQNSGGLRQSKVKESKVLTEEKEKEKEKPAATVVATPPNPSIDISIRKGKFKDQCAMFLEKYGKDMMNEFYAYWTETSKSGKKMRFEGEKFFDMNRRLATWASKPFNKQNHESPQPIKRDPASEANDRQAAILRRVTSAINSEQN